MESRFRVILSMAVDTDTSEHGEPEHRATSGMLIARAMGEFEPQEWEWRSGSGGARIHQPRIRPETL